MHKILELNEIICIIFSLQFVAFQNLFSFETFRRWFELRSFLRYRTQCSFLLITLPLTIKAFRIMKTYYHKAVCVSLLHLLDLPIDLHTFFTNERKKIWFAWNTRKLDFNEIIYDGYRLIVNLVPRFK